MKSYNNHLTSIAPGVFLLGIIGMIFPLFAGAAILQDLKKGDQHPSVKELQKILNSDPETRLAASGPGSSGNETNYFGSLTYDAARRFQQKYSAEILTPAGLTAPTGFVGTYTRRVLNIMAAFPTPTPTLPPSSQGKPTITAVTPQIITQSPIALTITGTNFTPTGNTVYVTSEPRYAYTNLSSRDNKIELTFHSTTVEDLKSQILSQISSADYNAAATTVAESIIERIPGEKTSRIKTFMQVKNTNGESASVTIIIDVTAILLAQ